MYKQRLAGSVDGSPKRPLRRGAARALGRQVAVRRNRRHRRRRRAVFVHRGQAAAEPDALRRAGEDLRPPLTSQDI